jgi:hypothetical protein
MKSKLPLNIPQCSMFSFNSAELKLLQANTQIFFYKLRFLKYKHETEVTVTWDLGLLECDDWVSGS